MGTNKAGDGAPAGPCKIAVLFAPPESGEADWNEAIIDDPIDTCHGPGKNPPNVLMIQRLQ